MPATKGEFSWMFFVPTVVLLGLAIFFFVKNVRIMTTFERATGKIVRFDSKTVPGRSQTVYQTIVEYTSPDGVTHEAKSLTSSSSVSSKTGDQVTIYYNRSNPEQAHVHTFRDSWLHILLLGGIGFILFVCWFGILKGGVAVGAMEP